MSNWPTSRAASPTFSVGSTRGDTIRYVGEDVPQYEGQWTGKKIGRGRGRLPRPSRPPSAASSVASTSNVSPAPCHFVKTASPPSPSEGRDVIDHVVATSAKVASLMDFMCPTKPRGHAKSIWAQSGSHGVVVQSTEEAAAADERRPGLVNGVTAASTETMKPHVDAKKLKEFAFNMDRVIAFIEEILLVLDGNATQMDVLAALQQSGDGETFDEQMQATQDLLDHFANLGLA